ncbi:hypothetical protein BC628DRAFT_1313124 [Trametes gibbosa]|nr:hypothetical protein BC628DRAFT_1313124 [Trametes gibbosa]
MRPLACIPLGLLALLPFVAPAQLPLSHVPAPATQAFTLIEALSADPDYLSLLKLVQRAKLVPTLNRLNGSTFFAPTNDAISRHADSNPLWKYALDENAPELTDNLHLRLRQELFYHLFNYTLSVLPTEQTPQQYKTLLYPRDYTEPPTRAPPPFPPWMPIPNGTLGTEPQRLRLSYRDDAVWAGVDAFGNRGAKVVKDRVETSNGLLIGLDDVLEMPPDLATVISRHPKLSYFSKILTPELTAFLNSTSTLTVFLPEDDAWQAMQPWERLYLESGFASDDLLQILNLHTVIPNEVKWSDSFTDQAVNFTTIHGRKLEIVPVEENKIKVSEAELVEPDVYASNGVLHTVSSLLIPPGALRHTPEKYLLGLNCTEFVSLIHSVNLTHLINDPDAQYTILAPRDDVLKLFGHHELPHRGSEELKRVLQYHFLPGKWAPKKLQDGMLVESALEEPGLDGRQVMTIEVTDEGKKKDDSKAIRFAGAGVMGEHADIDNTVIYFVSRPLVPPGDVMETALPELELSTFIAGIFSTNLAEVLKSTPRATLLMPPNGAFKRIGLLVSNHLLASSSKADFERVIRHHALFGVEYADPLVSGSQRTFGTLEGSDLHVERRGTNRTVYFTPSGGWAEMQAELHSRNMLTQTGVIHEVSDILIPRSVHLTVGKLSKAAKATTMTTMVIKAGFGWVLNGTAPPEGSPWSEVGMKTMGWTLLCPTDDAFKQVNLTDLYANEERLQAIVAQHLIPTPNPSPSEGQTPGKSVRAAAVIDALVNNRPLPLDDSATYATLQSMGSAYGDVLVRVLDGDEGTVLGIKGARGRDGAQDWARVLSWGRSTTGDGSGGVVQIDRLLVPYAPTWYEEYGGPVAVGVGGVMLILLFFLGVRWVWRRDTTEATYEPSDAALAEETQRTSTTTESVKSFVSGGVGGVAAVLVGHPFDLTKTRLQTAAPGTYTGAIDVVKKAVAHDGVKGLYRGVVPPLVGVTPIFALSFWAYDMSKALILSLTPQRTSKELSIPELATAGFLSAIPTTLVTAPVERAKVLLQVQGQTPGGPQYKGVFDVVRHLYREGGVRSVFRGSVATVARDGPGSAAYFAAYEVTKKMLTPVGASPSDLNLGAVIVAGGTAGIAMWSIAIPPDVLKSRIQSAPTGTYSGFLDCARKTIAADGVAALWRGLGPAMARAFPANAATFVSDFLARYITMSSSSTSGYVPHKITTTKGRCLSASQVAKDPSAFEEWSSFQNCEQASLAPDVPPSIEPHTSVVFKLDGHLPSVWLAGKVCFPEFLKFLAAAQESSPELFSDVPHDAERRGILRDLQNIFTAWESACRMRDSSRKWSEADYASGVYGGTESSTQARAQCTISLPYPVSRHRITPDAVRILNGKTAKPDGALFIPSRLLAPALCKGAQSPYNVLHRRSREKKHTSDEASSDASFRCQSTICAKLPDASVFEIASAFWEDKKPSQDELAVAYRQNRMATTAALRQLHALGVHAPVFGLVWAEGSVRAHADWWVVTEAGGESVLICSAPYASLSQTDRRRSSAFHQWNLAEPADIIEVYLLIRNLDRWTAGMFRDTVVADITTLAQRVEAKQTDVVSWVRKGDVAASGARERAPPVLATPAPLVKVTVEVAVETADPAPAKRKGKKRKHAPRTSMGSTH